MYSIIRTQKGCIGILYDQHMYRQQKVNLNGSIRWVCTNRSCSCTLTIMNNNIEKIKGTHQHEKLDRTFSIIKTIEILREKVVENVTTPVGQIYNETLSHYRQENGKAGDVPMFEIVRSTLYRDRAKVFPKIPSNLSEISLELPFKKNLYDEQMCFCEDVQTFGVLAFASTSALRELAHCSIWNADGTFKTAPKHFNQMYTIHGHNNYSMKPMVFAALVDKHEQTYTKLLESLVAYAQENNIILSPSSILIDFEIAAYNAFRKVFPNANILYCHFHFAKNMVKHIRKLHIKDVLKIPTIKRQLANIISLPLLPLNKMYHAFIRSSKALIRINRKFQTFASYIEKNYMLDSKYNQINWNHYSTLTDRPRTNNHVEGYHRYLNSRLIKRPNVWKWIMYIQKADEETIIRCEQEHQQKRTTRRRKKRNMINDELLAQIKQEYQNKQINIIQYQKRIRSISYTYIDTFNNNISSDEEDND